MTPDEVLRLVGRCWGPKKKRNLASPTLGEGISWAENIAVVEEIIEDCIRRSLTSPYRSSRANIARRITIDKAARSVSDTPHFYSLPLYVSEGLLLGIIQLDVPNPQSSRQTKIALPPHTREHTVPLAVHLSGERILANPEMYLPNLRRALAAPISYVTKEEDKALQKHAVKTHEIPFFPFRRYHGIAKIYRTDTGEEVDLQRFTFRDHLRVMALHPAYASILPLFISAKSQWRARMAKIRTDCATQQGV
jgi:hypothetical protein